MKGAEQGHQKGFPALCSRLSSECADVGQIRSTGVCFGRFSQSPGKNGRKAGVCWGPVNQERESPSWLSFLPPSLFCSMELPPGGVGEDVDSCQLAEKTLPFQKTGSSASPGCETPASP